MSADKPNFHLSRRDFLRLTTVGGAALLTGACTNSQPAQEEPGRGSTQESRSPDTEVEKTPSGKLILKELQNGNNFRIVEYDVESGTKKDISPTELAVANIQDVSASPSGDKLAFVYHNVTEYAGDRRDSVVITDRNGSIERVLPVGKNMIAAPVWSHDGSRIAFYTFDEEDPDRKGFESETYIADVASGEILDTIDSANHPSFHPADSDIILYSQEGVDVNTQGHVMRKNISKPGSETVLTNGIFGEWSPDGERIVVSKVIGGEDYPRSVVLDSMHGNFMNEFEVAINPQWSPDGSQLAFIKFRPDGSRVLSIGNIVDGSERVIDEFHLYNFDITWMNGKWLASSDKYAGMNTVSVRLYNMETGEFSVLPGQEGVDQQILGWTP